MPDVSGTGMEKPSLFSFGAFMVIAVLPDFLELEVVMALASHCVANSA
jgi:hypothetical protein